MRKVTTQTISINAEYNKAFNYISNPLTQKEWAINFMKLKIDYCNNIFRISKKKKQT